MPSRRLANTRYQKMGAVSKTFTAVRAPAVPTRVVPCPTCGAEPGAPCHASGNHIARTRIATRKYLAERS